jgi:monoamine oxidase
LTFGNGAAGAPPPLSRVLAPGAPAVQPAYDASPPGAGGPGVLATFFSQNAPAYLGFAPAARRAAVLASFASWFGAAAAAPLEYVEKDWPAGERTFRAS